MDVLAQLVVDLGRVALGLTSFSWLAWAYVTVLLLVVGPVFVQVAPKVVDPPARLLATDPLRVVIWMPISLGVLLFGTIALILTIFGSVLAPIGALLLALAGYLALARLAGERLGRVAGIATVPPWLAAMLGIMVLRAVRAVPYVGALAHSLLGWVALAAATCVAVRAARQWHRRRMPDIVQFRGETLVEWYPDGDPVDGKPSIGTGRPVLGNVRGEEDRTPPSPDEPGP